MSKSRYIAGLRAVEQLMQGDLQGLRRIYAEYQTVNPRVEAIIRAARQAEIEILPANRARLTQIGGEARHQGVVAEIRRDTLLDEAGLRSMLEERLGETDAVPPLLLVLDGVQDPHNLGACIRTADAAGVDAIVVPRQRAAGMSPTVSKVAAGAAEITPFAAVANLGKTLGWLTDYGFRIVGTSDSAEKTLFDTDLSGPIVLVMGREHSGVSRRTASRCDTLVSVPMAGVVSSLNVSVATGVCLFEIVRQRNFSA